MAELTLSTEDKLQIVINRITQLLQGKYDQQLNLRGAEQAGDEKLVESIKEQLEDFNIALRLHEDERAELLAELDAARSDEVHSH